nr:hypothetical protein L203_01239 [Cryptococcus depauperatus CBS 7841]
MLDAMKALQLMDPKMDTGISSNHMFQVIFDPQTLLSPTDTLWIMDQMLALEVLWYRGGSLGQTVYTSLYYHNIQFLAAPPNFTSSQQLDHLLYMVFRSFILLYCKSIDLVYNELSKGHVFEGEDCFLDHHGIPIHFEDSVESIIGIVSEALGWLESEHCLLEDNIRDQLINRVVFHRNFVLYLESASNTSSTQKQNLLVMRMIAEDIIPSTKASSVAMAAFDSHIISYLRQNMPYPEQKQLNFSDSWDTMLCLVKELLSFETMEDEASWESWKTRFIAFFDDDHGGLSKTSQIITQAIRQEIPSHSVLAVLEIFSSQHEYAESRQFLTWRTLLAKNMTQNLTLSLSNRPRQYRLLAKLSAQYHERAAMCRHLSQQDSSALCAVLDAFRLDCILDSVLSAFDSNLVHSTDERETWWWITTVAAARNSGHYSATVRALWAKAWFSVGLAMQILLTLVPLGSDIPKSIHRFKLRYKHFYGEVYLPDGLKKAPQLVPDYYTWLHRRQLLDEATKVGPIP